MKTLRKMSVFGVLISAFFLVSCGGGGGGGTTTPTTNPTAPTGTGSFTLDPVTKVISGSITTSNVSGATAAHIHDGNVGVAGPVVIPLVQATPGTWSVPVGGGTLSDAQIARLQAGGYYVNVHTPLNPAGEIRGQLTLDSSTANKFNAALDLAHEVPTPITPTGGGTTVTAPTGSGSFTLDPVTKVISGSITTSNVTSATAAHIHDGDVGVAGAVVVPLEQATPGTWSVPVGGGTLTDANIARLQAGGFYVNVHTTLNPAGEIRGQLTPDSSTANKFNATLDLAHEVPTPITPTN